MDNNNSNHWKYFIGKILAIWLMAAGIILMVINLIPIITIPPELADKRIIDVVDPTIWYGSIFGLIALGLICIFWELRSYQKSIKITDKLVNEPTLDQILNMTLKQQKEFVCNAKMQEPCESDEWGNRAMIRACYLINEAYKMQENGVGSKK